MQINTQINKKNKLILCSWKITVLYELSVLPIHTVVYSTSFEYFSQICNKFLPSYDKILKPYNQTTIKLLKCLVSKS